MSRLIDADALLTDRKKSKYYHLPNGDIAIPIIDIEHAPTIEPEWKNRLVKEIKDKTSEETYDFLSWLMVDYGLQFTNTRQAVIEWLRGEEDD